MKCIVATLLLLLVPACSGDAQNGQDGGSTPAIDADTKPPDRDANIDPTLCGGDCRDIEYSACSCGADDPCSWAQDGFCDDECDSFASSFDDAEDCEPACQPEVIASGQDGASNVLEDSTHLYWLSSGDGVRHLVRLPKNGGNTQILASVDTIFQINAIAQDDTHLYWTLDSELNRVPKSGGAIEFVADTDAGSSHGLAVDGTHVYWTNTNSDTIDRVAKSGGTAISIVTGQDAPFALAIDNSRVYWSTFDGALRSSTLTGGDLQTIETGSDLHRTIVLNGSHVYWIVSGTIRRRLTSGGTIETIVNESGSATRQLAVDNSNVYFSLVSTSGATLSRAPNDGGATTVLVENESSAPDGLVQDAQNIYWAANGSGTEINKLSRSNCGI